MAKFLEDGRAAKFLKFDHDLKGECREPNLRRLRCNLLTWRFYVSKSHANGFITAEIDMHKYLNE